MVGLFDRLQSEIETRQRVEGITPADLLDLQQADQSCIDTLVTDVVVGNSAT